MQSMNRSIVAIVRCILRKLLSISNRLNMAGGSVSGRLTVGFRVSGSCSTGMVGGWAGQRGSFWSKYVSSCHQIGHSRISVGSKPRESTSAGFSCVLTYFYSKFLVSSWI
uniref:(northern house mosquito) hypothetical protein n=1 Tax=Culex pipiens TaxID=7175 RepID=A0A8D8ATE9_CULPI